MASQLLSNAPSIGPLRLKASINNNEIISEQVTKDNNTTEALSNMWVVTLFLRLGWIIGQSGIISMASMVVVSLYSIGFESQAMINCGTVATFSIVLLGSVLGVGETGIAFNRIYAHPYIWGVILFLRSGGIIGGSVGMILSMVAVSLYLIGYNLIDREKKLNLISISNNYFKTNVLYLPFENMDINSFNTMSIKFNKIFNENNNNKHYYNNISEYLNCILSKMISETIVISLDKKDETNNIIIRPSIIGPSWNFPEPGWGEQTPSTLALVLGGTAGRLLRTTAKSSLVGHQSMHVVPVDFVTKILINHMNASSENGNNNIYLAALIRLGLSTIVYKAMAIFLGVVAGRYELILNELVMQLICVWEYIIFNSNADAILSKIKETNTNEIGEEEADEADEAVTEAFETFTIEESESEYDSCDERVGEEEYSETIEHIRELGKIDGEIFANEIEEEAEWKQGKLYTNRGRGGK